ncbi:transposase [Budvicia diplopodorum]|uniref:transposase n=1 Tax=Budvicia diplopodorum TaxID=1119056 RepID=UPI003CCCF164
MVFNKLFSSPPLCPYCNITSRVKKHGKGRTGYQRYFCTSCSRTFQTKYIYNICVKQNAMNLG